jgi:hypothetical protein
MRARSIAALTLTVLLCAAPDPRPNPPKRRCALQPSAPRKASQAGDFDTLKTVITGDETAMRIREYEMQHRAAMLRFYTILAARFGDEGRAYAEKASKTKSAFSFNRVEQLEKGKVTINGDRATLREQSFEHPSMSIDHAFRKVDGSWRMVENVGLAEGVDPARHSPRASKRLPPWASSRRP